MKRLLSLTAIAFAITTFGLSAQEAAPVANAPAKDPQVVFMPNLIGPVFGLYAANINFNTGEKVSIDTDFGYFNLHAIPLLGDQIDQSNQFWFANLKAGPTFHFDRVFNGFFIGPYAKGAYFTISDGTTTFEAASLGGGIKAGWTGTWDWFSLSLGAGYEYVFAMADVTGVDPSMDDVLNQVRGGSFYALVTMGFAVY